jgi:hypothetical protein
MWLRLCSLNNPPPVVALPLDVGTGGLQAGLAAVTFALSANVRESNSIAGINNYPMVVRRQSMGDQCVAAGAPCLVGDEHAAVGSLTSDNLLPWCVTVSKSLNHRELVDPWFENTCVGPPGSPCVHPPRCPGTYDDLWAIPPATWNAETDPPWTPSNGWDLSWDTKGPVKGRAADEWSLRGAINAGLAVFLYLDSVSRDPTRAKPAYDHCEQVKP